MLDDGEMMGLPPDPGDMEYHEEPEPMSAEVILVTPEMAAKYLANNEANRPISNGRVAEFKTELKAGRWMGTSDGLGFDTAGRLINGQHRLKAIVETGISAYMVVVRGLDPKSQQIMDTGRKRSLANSMEMERLPEPKGMAGASVFVIAFISPGGFQANEKRHISNPVAVDFALRHQDDLTRAVSIGKNVARNTNIPLQVVSGLAFMQAKVDPEVTATFWTGVATGANLEENDPRLRLLKVLAPNKGVQTRPHRVVVAALCIKAWNAYVEGKKIKTLRWPKGSTFPVLKGLAWADGVYEGFSSPMEEGEGEVEAA